MNKHPLRYKKKDLDKVRLKLLRIEVGPTNKDIIQENLEGRIIEYSLAANPPYLPAEITFRLENGSIRKFNFFEIKSIERI